MLLFVGAAAWNEWRKAEAQAAARALGDGILAALDAGDPAARATALAEVSAAGDAAAIVLLMSAAAARDGGDTAAAITRLAALEADPGVGAIYRQLATLKRVLLEGANGTPPADRIAALGPLTVPGGPFRLLAEEQVALAEAEAGDAAAAIARLRSLLAEDGVSAGLRARASQTIVALGGDLDET
jgi:hypothetical protein